MLKILLTTILNSDNIINISLIIVIIYEWRSKMNRIHKYNRKEENKCDETS